MSADLCWCGHERGLHNPPGACLGLHDGPGSVPDRICWCTAFTPDPEATRRFEKPVGQDTVPWEVFDETHPDYPEATRQTVRQDDELIAIVPIKRWQLVHNNLGELIGLNDGSSCSYHDDIQVRERQ